MCLSTVCIKSDDREVKVMQDVAHMTSQDDGFLLFGLFGEQKFVQGKIKYIDFVDQHTVVLEDE